MKAPCQDCQSRTVGCHSTCGCYQAFNRERIEMRQRAATLGGGAYSTRRSAGVQRWLRYKMNDKKRGR